MSWRLQGWEMAEMGIDRSAEVVVARLAGKRDSFRDYRLLIDGRRAATLAEGDVRTLSLQPGTHELWLSIDWARSKKLTLQLPPGSRSVLKCYAAGGVYSALVDSTLRCHRYIELSEASEPEIAEAAASPSTSAEWVAKLGRAATASIVAPLCAAVVVIPILIAVNPPFWLMAVMFFAVWGATVIATVRALAR